MKLNSSQRVSLLVGLAVAVAMGLFPPWEKRAGWTELFIAEGHHLITFKGSIPRLNRRASSRVDAGGWRIDTTTICVQWMTVALATAAAMVFFGGRTRKPSADG